MKERFLTTALALVALTACAQAKIDLTVNMKNGDTIAGETTFKVAVITESLVTSVEFYVGKDLRDTDESTPYEFTIDTLQESQGELEVTFAAYTKSGESVKKTYKLKIDNGLDKGAAFHVAQGEEALTTGKWDVAIEAARRALKIDGSNNPARVVMARANLGKGALDLAEKYSEDAAAAAPDNPTVLNLVCSVQLRKAFMSLNSGTSKMEAVEGLKAALVKAAETRRKVLDMAVDSFGEVTDANRLAFCDRLIAAGRYSRVISELDDRFRKDFKNNDIVSRLLFSQIRAGRVSQAAQTLENVRKYGGADGYVYGLRACFMAYTGQTELSKEAEKEAILDDPMSIGVKTAQAYLALRRGDTKTSASVLSGLNNSEGQSPVVNYGIASLAFMVSEFDMARAKFETALLAEPALWDMLVERGNQSVWFSLRTDMDTSIDPDFTKRQRALGAAFFEAARAARPESYEALTGLALVASMEGKKEDAVRLGKAATSAAPEYAAAQWAYAAALFDAGRREEAKVAVKKAEQLDRELEGKPYPTTVSAWGYFYGKGRVPIMLPPGS